MVWGKDGEEGTHRRDSVKKSRHENNKIILFKTPKIVVIADEMNMIVSKTCYNVEVEQ